VLLVQPVIRVTDLLGPLERRVQSLVRVGNTERVLSPESSGVESEASDRKL
jgi:hypothetical protein